MPDKIRQILNILLITSLFVLGNFALSLLTNYASNLTPNFFEEKPVLLWSAIGLLIIVLIILNVLAEIGKAKALVASDSDANNIVNSYDELIQHDVFISYSHKNNKFVEERLIPFLKERSFTYCIDNESFKTGSTSIEEMERCVNNSKRVILVLTKDYLESEWAKFENIMAQTLDPSAKSRKLIPLLVEDCELPLRLKIYNYRDLRNNQKSQWDL